LQFSKKSVHTLRKSTSTWMTGSSMPWRWKTSTFSACLQVWKRLCRALGPKLMISRSKCNNPDWWTKSSKWNSHPVQFHSTCKTFTSHLMSLSQPGSKQLILILFTRRWRPALDSKAAQISSTHRAALTSSVLHSDTDAFHLFGSLWASRRSASSAWSLQKPHCHRSHLLLKSAQFNTRVSLESLWVRALIRRQITKKADSGSTGKRC